MKTAKLFSRAISTAGATLAGCACFVSMASAQPPHASTENGVEHQTYKDECIASLPFARGQVFCTLDQYLIHLQKQGAIDLPWWREIRPGVYERVTNMPNANPETMTREELLRRFGFKS